MKLVFKANDIPEAHFVRGLLESHGLAVTVRGEDLWGTRGEVPFTETWPTVWVEDDAQENEALTLIDTYQSGRADPGPRGLMWTCPACGQQLEPQFTSCWQCGTERSL
jgi:hypothetical protein